MRTKRDQSELKTYRGQPATAALLLFTQQIYSSFDTSEDLEGSLLLYSNLVGRDIFEASKRLVDRYGQGVTVSVRDV